MCGSRRRYAGFPAVTEKLDEIIERLMPPRTLVVQHVGNDFLAGAALAGDDDAAVASAHDFHEIEDRPHPRAVTDDHLID